MKQKNTQNGNAIAMILVAVALFAALGYAFSNTSRTSNRFLSDEEAKAYANQIISYGNEVRQAVKRLTLRGCSDTEISFENNVVSGYTNPNAPTDKSCHVFDIAGGGINYNNPPKKLLDSGKKDALGFGEIFFPNLIAVDSVGSDCDTPACTELIFDIPYIKENICFAINRKLNLPDIKNDLFEQIVDHGYEDLKKFKGSYNFSALTNKSIIGNNAGSDNFPKGYRSGCFFRSDLDAPAAGYESPYVYYHVLLAR